MSEPTAERKLDVASSASVDEVALNNLVVSMRPVVKRAKLYVVDDLVKKAKKWRARKGTEDQLKKNSQKAENLIGELKAIQVLKNDFVSKYALGATETFQQLVMKPHVTLETRAMARLSEQKFVQDVVKKFRKEHEDWKSLAAYLMTKHTSREFKKRKEKKKFDKLEANAKAKETIVKSYLQQKLGGTEKDSDKDIASDEGVSSDEGEEEAVHERLQPVSSSIEGTDQRRLDDEESDYDYSSEESSLFGIPQERGKQVSKQKEHFGAKEKHVVAENDKSNAIEKTRGEMIVKKLNLDELETDEVADKVLNEKVPEILLDSKEASKHKKKKKDPFFAGAAEDDDLSDAENDGEFDDGEDDNDEYQEDDEGDEVMADRPDRDGGRADLFKGKKAFSTTFVGSLSSNEMMPCEGKEFRSNEDWKRIRQERRQGQGRGGRGQPFSRGGVGRGAPRGHSGSDRYQGHGRSEFRSPRGRGGGHDSRLHSGRGHRDHRGRGSDRGHRSDRGQGSDVAGGSYRGRGSEKSAFSGPSSSIQGGKNPPRSPVKSGDMQPAEKLHPSWEASRKRKQEQTTIQPFAGKKIKFDD